ncbi:PREDICTED: nuclear pore complex protein NUP205-like isoform X3 [Lupinus angustifolius]|uniref:nuclear pore complex protein NUP205-like isoform X3 n=1 Tax=Lupinus angustifolius TaxID=3871 RepID=UPI00092F816D|nr:PREDICTED: nuclear pore complex protein NUP205-like isoform X3 [Lupinus angustifolius]
MVSPKQLLSTLESTLLGPSPPTAAQRVELLHAIRTSSSSFQSLLSYSTPKSSDRNQVQSKSVRLPDSSPITLDDQDVQIALKLSDDLHLNEVDCVRLLVSANQEWGLMGRGPLEILRLAAGLWYTERRDLITSLHLLLRAVVLDQGLEDEILVDIQKYLEHLINSGLRQRLISLIKELNREDSSGLGGPQCEPYILDSRGSLVERRAVVSRERLIIGHCLVLSVLVVRTSPKDVKDIFSVLKDCASEVSVSNTTVKHQITFSLLFALVVAFVSDGLSTVPDKASILSSDASFRREFHELVMATGNDPVVEGFIGGIRLAWVVHLMLIQDGVAVRETVLSGSSNEMGYLSQCLDVIFSTNSFQFLLDKILHTASYQNEDEDMIYMYNAYLHKLITCFLSNSFARDKIKESKERTMSVLSPYRVVGSHDFAQDRNSSSQHGSDMGALTFNSILDFVSEIYQKEPELLSGNDVLWTFVNFAGEDHTTFQTLVTFLNMLSTLASSQEGASKVYELLQGKAFRSIGWSTLFECLTIYDDKFKQSLQTAGAMLPDIQEGDAKALVAYLNVLKKVVENGNPIERKNWFPDIEPLFKLLSYENVPPYLKGALRNAIATFIHVSPVLKDSIWTYLEQYDLPVVVGTDVQNSQQPMGTQVYDMQFELNEIEARREQYPSTISFLNLINALIAEERDLSDRGRRFIGIFRFIYDHVFGPFPQRAYADPCEKWQLVGACLQHFRMILTMYDVKDEDFEGIVDQSRLSTMKESSPLQTQLPVLELLKDFMSGKTAFRNIMGILLPGVNSIIAERSSQIYGQLLENAVQLSLEIIILVLEKDLLLSDYWRPLYQPLDIILSHDHNQIVALLEYVRYDLQPKIQQSSIKIMSILSSRMVGLVQLLLKSNAANSLIEDYAACLELRSEESQTVENNTDDPGILIMQLLIDNISRPAPNITHLLLKFDLDVPVERTVLQPKFYYSCMKVILDILENLLKPDVNALLHEFGFQLLYELCIDPLTCEPTMDLLSNKKYHFFIKHLDTICSATLPKRNSNQPLRISSLHQRAWLLKLLAVELHAGDVSSSTHREACQTVLSHLFGQDMLEIGGGQAMSPFSLQATYENAAIRTVSKSKVLELLEIIQFRCPDTSSNLSNIVAGMKYDLLVEDILGNPGNSGKGGVYYYSERNDRLIDLASFHDKLWQVSNLGSEVELNDVRETIQQLLRWGWKYNKNLEEQAAQLHMVTAWSQIVEVSASRRLALLEDRSEILFQVLDASLSACASPDCSLKMAFILSQVALTCMAKLRDERFLFPGSLSSDNITCLDLIVVKQLSNGACLTILFKLIMAILRNESSEALRRRQYALLLSYFQYCQNVVDPDVPTTVLQFLLLSEQDNDYIDLPKIDKEQAELARANFSTLRKEAQSILDLVIKDATHGSEPGKTISLYVLDALICIDHERYFLNQLQSRGFLRSCFTAISSVSNQDGGLSLDSLQRACTFEAELALLLRISHKYEKSGAQVLFSMGILEHLSSGRIISSQGGLRRVETRLRRDMATDIDRQRMIVTPILRLVFSLTSLVDTSEFLEMKNKIVREIIDFVKGHQPLLDHILRVDIAEADDLRMEQINLVVGILSKIWPYEQSSEYGFVQGLFGMMHALFSRDLKVSSFAQSISPKNQRNSELQMFKLCFSLSSYLYFLVTKKSLRLQYSDATSSYPTSVEIQQPTLSLLNSLLTSVTTALERASEEKSLLLNKIRDINELSRQEVDEIINMCVQQDYVPSSDNIHKRRYIAMVEMCQVVASWDQQIILLLPLSEHVLNIILIHLQESCVASDSTLTTKTITYGAKYNPEQDIAFLCGKLVPALERLELLSEDKIGRNLKVFNRLVTSAKDVAIQKLVL